MDELNYVWSRGLGREEKLLSWSVRRPKYGSPNLSLVPHDTNFSKEPNFKRDVTFLQPREHKQPGSTDSRILSHARRQWKNAVLRDEGGSVGQVKRRRGRRDCAHIRRRQRATGNRPHPNDDHLGPIDLERQDLPCTERAMRQMWPYVQMKWTLDVAWHRLCNGISDKQTAPPSLPLD